MQQRMLKRRKMYFVLLALVLLSTPAPAADYVTVPGGTFASVLPADANAADVTVAPFRLRREPVTNAEFVAFVTANPQWRRDRIARVFAQASYLQHWQSATQLGASVL